MINEHTSSSNNQIRLGTRTITIHSNERSVSQNHRKVKMTPTEYRICLAFFEEFQQRSSHVKPWADGLLIGSYVPQRLLQQRCSIANQKVLRKHICHINRKLELLDIHLLSLRLWGFLLVLYPSRT